MNDPLPVGQRDIVQLHRCLETFPDTFVAGSRGLEPSPEKEAKRKSK